MSEQSENGSSDSPTEEATPTSSPQKSPQKAATPKKETPKKETPKKETPKKEKPKEEQPNEEDEDDESSDEELVGLLEKDPVVEGKRQRKKTERLEVEVITTPKEEFRIPEGKGTKLGEIERVEWQLQRNKSEDLKPLHRILFNKGGAATVIKRHIRQFSGFDFEKDSKEYEKKKEQILRYTVAALKYFCDTLDIEKKGNRDELVEKLMEFLMEPVSSGKAIPQPKKKRGRKKKGEGKADKEEGGKKKRRKQKAKSDEEVENDDDDSSDEEEEEEEKPKKRKADVPKKAPKKTPKKTPKKQLKVKMQKPTPKKKPAVEISSDDDESDDEPLAKKIKKPPTNAELKDVVKKILEGANLEEITMKSVCKQVYEKYPDFDLTDRKDFIKTTVKSIIS
ncbi:PREDICTED: protein DEK-like [Branchiostoma belcheri]|uniref:Protein DEK n=1 Tax=Branchiostoma belcheri TaxID=7741 RepID=A0A6P5A6R7_BRABE|nr:PREDICTED: protein DEK-like [Branchiostoma belcheri]